MAWSCTHMLYRYTADRNTIGLQQIYTATLPGYLYMHEQIPTCNDSKIYSHNFGNGPKREPLRSTIYFVGYGSSRRLWVGSWDQ